MNLFAEFDKADIEAWQKEAERLLKGQPLESLSYLTDEDITIRPLYTRQDLSQEFKNEYPGFKYYLRSNKLSGYRSLPWNVVQRIDVANPKKANELIKNEIQNGISEFLIETYDFTENNLIGVIINDIEDLQTLFEDVDIANIGLHFKTTFPTELLPLFIAFLDKNQISGQRILGSIQYDFYRANLSNGKLLEKNSFRNLYSECLHLCNSYLPNFKTIVIDGTFFHECGATATQELSFTIGKAVEILKGLSQLGIDINELSQKILFKIALGSNIFFNVGKIRALRLLWSFIIEQFNISDSGLGVPIYAITSERNKSKLDIYVNMLRNTAETFSAII
ncbi:MAG: methylmalonyl-CoA mutase family protein, partial [Candidatus Kapaibacteriota bacterium]